MKAIKDKTTGQMFSNWRLNGLPQFVDPAQMCGQIAFFDDFVVESTVKDLENSGHKVEVVDIIFQ